jgi:hypothetical protein
MYLGKCNTPDSPCECISQYLFLLLEYRYEDGEDLDTKTSAGYSDKPDSFGAYVGFCKELSVSDHYLWGGDQTSAGPAAEYAVIKIHNMLRDTPDDAKDSDIEGHSSANWFGRRDSGDVTVNATFYSGGVVYLQNGVMSISGGDELSSHTKTVNVFSRASDCVIGDSIFSWRYDRKTKKMIYDI